MVVTDDFTRADAATLGANWSDVGANWGIASNAAVSMAAFDTLNSTFWTANAIGNDQYAKATLKSVDRVGVVVRASGSGATSQYYFVRVTNSTMAELFARDLIDGLRLIGTAITGIFAVNDVLELRAVGTTLIVLQNGAELRREYDAVIASGAPGIHADTIVPQTLDTWEGGDLPPFHYLPRA